MAQTPTWRRRPLLGLVLLLLLVGAAYLAGLGGGPDPSASPSGVSPSVSATASASSSDTAAGTTDPATDPASGLPVVALSDLPPEAADTLELIARDGPFPYERDGVEFMNREDLLPPQGSGWYREYTVPTPGEDDRGARRIVTGEDGTVYYTADHYDSFVVVGP